MVTAFAVGGIVAPAGRLDTMMTALASGLAAAVVIGSSQRKQQLAAGALSA